MILSNALGSLAPLQVMAASDISKAAAAPAATAEATPPPAYSIPSTIYLPIVANHVAPTPTPTAEPVVSLEKGCETPGTTRGTELKQVDSTLSTLYCQRELNSTTTAPVDPVVEPNLTTDGSKIRVEIVAVDSATVAQTAADVQTLGADHLVIYQNLIAANVPLTQMPKLAKLATVQSVRFSDATNRANPVNRQEAKAQLRKAVPQAVASGPVVGQHVAQLQADKLQAAPYNLTGAGLKIGLISDSYDCYASSGRTPTAATGVTTGELPANVTVLNDAASFGLNCANQNDETRALVEAAYDVAPGATYAVASMGASKADFANSIQAMIKWGAQVIATDVIYINEAMFQDDVIAQLFDQAKAQGVTVFTLSHNNRDYSWQGAGLDSNSNGLLEFDKAGVEKLTFTPASSGYYRTILTWDQPFKSISGQQGNVDLALLIYRASDNALVSSADWNNYTNDPYEWTASNLTGGASYYIKIKKNSGATPTLVKILFQNSDGVTFSPAASAPTIYGNANALGAITVAGYAYNDLPYYFNSRGVVPILFDKAGNRLSNPVTRPKPDIAATTGYNTSFFGVDDTADADTSPNFWGTSASVPAAAGVGLLLLQAKPHLTPGQVASCLMSTARDITETDPGFDNITGAGLLQSVPAYECSLTMPELPTPTPSPTGPTPTPIATDNNQGGGNPGAGNTCLSFAVLVADYTKKTVERYDGSTGAWDKTLATGIPYGPNFILQNPTPNGPLLLTTNNGAIYQYDAFTGAAISSPFISAASPNSLVFTEQMRIGADGYLYVANFGNNKVQRFNASTGALVSNFITSMISPMGIVQDSSGNWYVSSGDYSASATYDIRKFNSNGVYQSTLYSYAGTGTVPRGLALGADGNLYVIVKTTTGARIDKFTMPAGTRSTFITMPTGADPYAGIIWGPDGYLYVANWGQGIVHVYNTAGTIVRTVTSHLTHPHGVGFTNCTVATATPTVTPTPTPTNTPLPPTATPTNTSLPPTTTPTATPTNTTVPPTATPTATPTNTPVPPTATPTNTSVPPTATPTNTGVPPTATNTAVPATNTATPTKIATPTNTPLPPTGSIGNRFWDDTNYNGIQDAGEPSVVGATVKLWVDSNNDSKPDTLLTGTTTDNSGAYQFGGLNANLAYVVQFVPPWGRTFTLKDAAGSTEATDSDANPTGYTDAVIVTAGQNSEIGAGLQPLSTISNRFWEDTNYNGIQDTGEVGVAGAKVKLWEDSNNDGSPDTPLKSTTTDSSGKYQFTQLDANLHYIVQFVPPSGRSFTLKDAAGSTESTDSDANPNGYTDAFTVTPGKNADIGAGLQPPATIGNRVWEDMNENGIQDLTEPGIRGVEVRLWTDNNNDGAPDTQLITTTTTNDGSYQFTNLDASLHYIVQFVPPTGRSFTQKDAPGSTESTDSDANPNGYTDGFTVAPGQNAEIGAGLLPVSFDLALNKTLATGQSALVELGDNVTFSLQVTNRSAITAANIEVVDYIPSGLTLNDSRWDTIGTSKADYVIPGPLAPGATTSIDIVMTVGTVMNNLRSLSGSCPTCGTVVNTAEIVSAEDVNGNMRDDVDLTNNQSQATIQVGVPALTLKLTTTTATAQPGALLTYQMIYSNTNAYVAKNVVIKTTVPQYTTFVAASSAPGWSCTAVTAGSTCTYTVGTVAPNTPASTPIAFTVVLDNPLDASALLIYNQSLLTYGAPPLTAWTTTLATVIQRTQSASVVESPEAQPHQLYLPLIEQVTPQARALFQKPALNVTPAPLMTFVETAQVLWSIYQEGTVR